MAKKLNKQLVAGLTIAGMVLMTGLAVFMIIAIPKGDPGPAAEEAAQAAEAGDYERALKSYQRAYQRSRQDGQDTPESHDYLVKVGEMALATGDARKALAAWRKVTLNDPNHEEAQQKVMDFFLELAQMRRGSWNDVLVEAEKLCQINPKNYSGLHAWGLALVQQRDVSERNLEEGLAKLEEAFEGDPGDAAFADSLARVYAGEGDREKALEVFEQLMNNLPEDPEGQADAYRQRGLFYLAVKLNDQRERNRAVENRALASDIQELDAKIAEANDEALRCLTKAHELQPEDVDNLLALGEYWARKQANSDDQAQQQAMREEYLQNARGYYEEAIQLEPDGYEGYLRLGRLYLSQREYEKAMQTLEARRERGVQREGYLASRNKYLMSGIRNEMFTVGMLMVENARDEDGRIPRDVLDGITAKLEDIYTAQLREGGEEDPGVLFMRGRLAMLRGKEIEAIQAMERASALLPGMVPELKQYLAQLYLRIGEYGPAEEALAEVLRAFPNNASAWAIRADLQLRISQPERAEQFAQRALEIDPQNRSAMMVLARVYEDQKNWSKVEQIREKLALAEGMDAVQQKLQQAIMNRLQAEGDETEGPRLLKRSEKLLMEVIEEDPLNIAALQQLALVMSQDEQRLPELQELLNTRLEMARAQQSKADTSATDQDATRTTEAIERLMIFADPQLSNEQKLSRLVEIAERTEDEYTRALQLYQLYRRFEDYQDQALEQLRKAHELKPEQGELIEQLFAAALQREDWDLAETMIDKARDLRLDRSSDAYFYRGRLRMAQSERKNNFEEAAELFRQGLSEFPTYSDGQVWLGRALVNLNRFEAAERAFAEAFRLNPRNGTAALALATLADRQGDLATKREYLAICARLMPDHPWVRGEMQALQDTRDPKKGIVRREQRRKTHPSDLNNLLRLADLYVRVEQYDKAKDVYESARQEEPANLQVARAYANFLRTKPSPEPSLAREALQQTIDAIPEDQPLQKAAAQLLLASHYRTMRARGGTDAPSLDMVDQAFEAAASIYNHPNVQLDIGSYYEDTGRFLEAEKWYRQSLALAEEQDQRETRRRAHQMVIDAMLRAQDIQRQDELKNELDAYDAEFDDPFSLLARSEYHANAGRLAEARNYIEQYVSENPDNPLGYVKRGDLSYRRSLWTEAAEDYRTAKGMRPDGFDYQHRLKLARCLENLGQEDLAIGELLSVISDAPTNTVAVQEVVRFYTQLEQWQPAIQLLNERYQSDEQNPLWPALLRQVYASSGDTSQAIRYGKEAARLSNFSPPQVGSLLGLCLRAERYDDLLTFVNDELPAERRQEPVVLVQTAAAHAGLGNTTEALALYNQALDRTNQFDVAVNVMADMQRRLGEAMARQVTEQRLAANPDDRYARFVKATEQRKAGDLDSFMTTTQALLDELDKSDPKLIPDRLALMRSLAMAHHQADQYNESRAMYEAMLQIDPVNVVALNNLAYMLMDQIQDPQSALAYSRKAAQIMPSNGSILDTFGWNLVLLGEHDEGIAVLQRAIAAEETIPALHYHLAKAYYERSQTGQGDQNLDTQEATTQCRRAHELFMETGNGDQELLNDIVELGTNLGLQLSAERPT